MIFSSTGEVNISNSQLAMPYLGLGVVVTLVFIMFAFSTIPDVHTTEHVKADRVHKDRQTGFSIPLVCFIGIAIYGAVWQ